jgi:ATP-binding cassette, subfamily C, type I secretion system permease/ATPase
VATGRGSGAARRHLSDKPKSEELRAVSQGCRRYFATALIFSLAINLLYLAGPLYMLQVYDRVINSASHVTLLMLTLVLLVAYAALAGLDVLRARVLTRASIRLERMMAGRVLGATMDGAIRGLPPTSQTLRDFDTFRQFVTGAGIHAIFDLPWAPIYIFVIFMLHPWLGSFALISAIALIALAVLGQWRIQKPMGEASAAASRNYAFTDMSLRNAEVVQAMGMMPGLLQRWSRDRSTAIAQQVQASDRAATNSSIVRFLRLSVQSLILGLGAYLVIERLITAGAMFAAVILLGRALQPVDQMVGSWRNMLAARGAFQRVEKLLAANPTRDPTLALPRPTGRLSVEGLVYAPPHSKKPILRGITFRLEAGETLGIIGPSGAGKSTLARQIVGVLAPSAGAVRLDGADVSTWPHESLGGHIGYLPQDIELFADGVAANISRFRNQDDDQEVIEAAMLAGLHEAILRLPNGYDTYIGEGGAVLSGGIRQRIGLARAVYGRPAMVVLDEPSSNLDSDGDAALLSCINTLAIRKVTVILISHRPNTLGAADKILLLRDGSAELFGPRDEVISRITQAASKQLRPAAVSS